MDRARGEGAPNLPMQLAVLLPFIFLPTSSHDKAGVDVAHPTSSASSSSLHLRRLAIFSLPCEWAIVVPVTRFPSRSVCLTTLDK